MKQKDMQNVLQEIQEMPAPFEDWDNGAGAEPEEVAEEPEKEEDPIMAQFEDVFEEEKEKYDQEEVKKSIGFLKSVKDYIMSRAFVDDCNDMARRKGVAPKRVAKTYLQKVGGIIGDITGTAVDVAEIGAMGLVNLISGIILGAISLIVRVARGLIRFITGGYTNHPEECCA